MQMLTFSQQVKDQSTAGLMHSLCVPPALGGRLSTLEELHAISKGALHVNSDAIEHYGA